MFFAFSSSAVANGGDFRKELDDHVTHVVTTRETFERCDIRRIRKAKETPRVAIVTASFITCLTSGIGDPINEILRPSQSSGDDGGTAGDASSPIREPARKRAAFSHDIFKFAPTAAPAAHSATDVHSSPPSSYLSSSTSALSKLAPGGNGRLFAEVEVDPSFPGKTEFKIHRSGLSVYSVTLVHSDISKGERGSNKFYGT